jgi:hypothetical protein
MQKAIALVVALIVLALGLSAYLSFARRLPTTAAGLLHTDTRL